jgi:AraC family transcriptional regulator of adaptative response/methylated-DNA-[protein]-cysteine methyltransferase
MLGPYLRLMNAGTWRFLPAGAELPCRNASRRRSMPRPPAAPSIALATETRRLLGLLRRRDFRRENLALLQEAITGITPRAYAAAHRARRVRDELSRGGTVTDAIYGAGFNSSGRFYATAAEVLGMRPTSFRSGGEGASIRFAVGECSLGSILVATSDRGVCAILLGEDPDALVRDLQDRFPRARLLGGDPGFERLVARVVGFVEAPALGLDLPLDVRGTAFQRRVWQALREIPAGTTATYAEIAGRIGAPKAVRAVAQACASNALAVAIPCHRVVRRDGALSGYRWGVQRKRALLDREAAS